MQKIITLLRERKILVTVLAIVFFIIVFTIVRSKNSEPEWTLGTVETGTVATSITVSGTVDATRNADLSFPIAGVLKSLLVKEGELVQKDTVLAELMHDNLSAQYQNAFGALVIAKADQAELLTGIRPEERAIAMTKVEIAKDDLARITREQNEKVTTAYRALLSTDLVARPKDKSNADTPPTVYGTYTCAEGTYTLDLFGSSAKSGYSYRLSGLEGGTYTAYTESPAPMGACGLTIQFEDGVSYGGSVWHIAIPNTESASYITNKNAYDLAITTRDNTINAASQALKLAEETASLTTAIPRAESVTREEARVTQAEAQLASINAQINDHILKAPFDGVVTHLDLAPGEIVATDPVLTMVSEGYFEIEAIIPEINITKIAVGQKADVVFDAAPLEPLTATITHISPVATEIAGVSYFETTLILDEPKPWVRGGLNADINIIIEKHEGALRIPKRFLIEADDGTYSVLVPDENQTRSVPVTVVMQGNDGYAHIEGLNEGDSVVAP